MQNISLFSLLFVFLLACGSPGGSSANAQSERSGVFPASELEDQYAGLAQATFAGGCFWCTEASFERIEGVVEVYSGYSGGSLENPTYQQVSSGVTDHAESIRVYYDSTQVSYQTLLEVFFVAHDPTQLNRQGPDVGPQYRSAIFYHDERQRQLAEKYMDELRQEGAFPKPIVTELAPLRNFYVAEAYHQDYYEHHPDNPYIRNVSRPKVEKVEKVFKDLLKPKYKA